MRDRILHIISLLVISFVVVSCSTMQDDDTHLAGGDGYITLQFSVPGVQMRGEVEDNEYESYLRDRKSVV